MSWTWVGFRQHNSFLITKKKLLFLQMETQLSNEKIVIFENV